MAVTLVSVLGAVGMIVYFLHEQRESVARIAALEEQLAAQQTNDVAGSTTGGADAEQPTGKVPANTSEPPEQAPQIISHAPPETPPHHPATTSTHKPRLNLHGDLSPETKALMSLSVAELEAKFESMLDHSLIPPSGRKKLREAYQLQKSLIPANADDRGAQLKYTLIQDINAYDKASMKAKRGDKLPLSELEQVFMTMEMKDEMAPETRKTILDQSLSIFDDGYVPEDKEFLQRITLAALIRKMANDPDIIDKKP